MFTKALKSRTVWILVFAFAFNGFQAIQGSFDPNLTLVVNALFMAGAGYFKLKPSQKY